MYDLTLVRVIGFKRQRLESLMKENKVWFFFISVFPWIKVRSAVIPQIEIGGRT